MIISQEGLSSSFSSGIQASHWEPHTNWRETENIPKWPWDTLTPNRREILNTNKYTTTPKLKQPAHIWRMLKFEFLYICVHVQAVLFNIRSIHFSFSSKWSSRHLITMLAHIDSSWGGGWSISQFRMRAVVRHWRARQWTKYPTRRPLPPPPATANVRSVNYSVIYTTGSNNHSQGLPSTNKWFQILAIACYIARRCAFEMERVLKYTEAGILSTDHEADLLRWWFILFWFGPIVRSMICCDLICDCENGHCEKILWVILRLAICIFSITLYVALLLYVAVSCTE